MKIFGLYKHKNCTDAAILVLKSFYVPSHDYYKLKVRWMNIVNPVNIFDMDARENLTIDRKKFNTEWDLLK